MDRTIVPPIERVRDINLLPLDKSVLGNGVELNVVNFPKDDVVRLDAVVDSGFWRQTVPGQCNMTCNMLMQGTRQHTSAEISEKLDFYGARMVAQSSNRYSIVSLLTLKKYVPQTFALMREMLTEATFPESEFELLRNRNLNNYLMRITQTKERASRAFSLSLYGENHPCGRFCTEETYRRITADDLKAYYARYYNPRNTSIFVSGNVDKEVEEEARRNFGAEWGGKEKAPAISPIPTETKKGYRHHEEMADSQQTSLRMGGLTMPVGTEEYYNFNVMLTLFGGYFGCRLFQNIREEKGYTYGISAYTIPNIYDSVLQVACETAPEYVEAVIKEVGNEADRLKNEPVGKEELDMLKNYMAAELCRNYESAFSTSVAYINMYCMGLKADHIGKTLNAINNITPEEIMESARRHLNTDEWNTVVAGKKAKKP